MASRFELVYGPNLDLDRIAREASAPTLAAFFEVVGFLIENPFPGESGADVTATGEDHHAVFRGGMVMFSVQERTVILTSIVLL